jgi:hypothetical protein
MRQALREAAAGLTGEATLNAVGVLELAAERREAGTIDPAGRPIEIGHGYRLEGDILSYRFTAEIDESDFRIFVAMAIDFAFDREVAFLEGQDALIEQFGQTTAFSAIFPFLRQRVFELSVSIGLKGILIPLERLALSAG